MELKAPRPGGVEEHPEDIVGKEGASEAPDG